MNSQLDDASNLGKGEGFEGSISSNEACCLSPVAVSYYGSKIL